MQITCNGEQREIKEGLSLLELLASLELPPDSIVAEVNKKIIDQNLLHATSLRNGDKVELIRFVGGG